MIADIRQAIKEDAPVDKIRQLKSDLQQAAHALSSAAAQQGQPGPGAGPQAGGGPEAGAGPEGEAAPSGGSGSNEDVIDAEFTEK